MTQATGQREIFLKRKTSIQKVSYQEQFLL